MLTAAVPKARIVDAVVYAVAAEIISAVFSWTLRSKTNRFFGSQFTKLQGTYLFSSGLARAERKELLKGGALA